MPLPALQIAIHIVLDHIRLLIAAFLLLLAYTLLGFLWVPQFLSNQAVAYVSQNLHRTLTLETVQFNPFTLALQITNARLAEPNGDRIVRIDYLMANAELNSLFTGTYHFSSVQLTGPRINVIVDAQGKLNLDFGQPDQPKQASTAPLPAIRIDDLRLRNGAVHVEDHTRATPFSTDFAPIQFTLQDFRTQPNHDNAYRFVATSEAHETLDWQGEFTVQPLGSRGTMKLGNLQATTLQSYLQDALPFRLLNGAMDVQGNYELTLGDSTEVKLSLPHIDVNNVQVAPKQSGTSSNEPWVTLGKLQLNDTRLSLQQRSVTIEQIRIDDALLNSWFDAHYNLNLLSLLGPNEPSEHPWTSTVKQIELANARVLVEDRSLSPAARFELFPIQLTVQNFSTAPHSSINLQTQLRINSAADFSANGIVDLDTQKTQLQLHLAQFPLKAVQAYADTSTDVTINGGAISADGAILYRGNTKDKSPAVQFKGNVEVANLATQDKVDGKDFINWQSLRLEQLNYSMSPDVFEVARIVARKPYGRVIIDRDGSTNIQHVLRIKPAEKKAAAQTEVAANKSGKKKSTVAPGMRTRINEILIEDGSADFTDNTVQPIFSTGMQRLNGNITGLSSANDSRAKVKLDGSVDSYAPVSISGEANFLAADTYSDIALKFSNMELTTFNPYSGKFAGYSIAKGKLTTDMRYQIRDRKLDAQHHIVIDQLEFGAATDSKDAVPLPIKLVVALLKDRNGVIDLELPVSGSIDDPSFKIGPIVWKAVIGLFTKIVTAPFAALGRLFGGGEELAYVDFVPGSAVLNATELDKLNKLAKGMAERPQLKLNVPLTVVTDADAAALNDTAFKQAVNEVLPNAATATPAQRLAALTTLYQRKTNAAPAWPAPSDPASDATLSRIAYLESQLKPLYAISAADRDALTRARADAVQAALLTNTELTPERVFLTAISNDVKSPEGVVRMELKLE